MLHTHIWLPAASNILHIGARTIVVRFFYFKRGGAGFVFVLMFLEVIVVQDYKAWLYTLLEKKQV